MVLKDAFKELFSQEEIVNKFLFDFKNVPPHEIARYIKVGKVYRYFIKNTDIHSFLCLLNKFPKKDSTDNFSKNKLYEILSKIREIEFGESEEESSKKIKEELTILKSNDYDKEIIRINNNLKTGKKVFLLSTYQTIGAGQNIQYEFHEDIPVVPIHNQPYGNKEKDYDAIYLEKPTHLLSHFSKGKKISEEDMFKYFFEIEYLYDSGVIDTKEKRRRIEFAFKRKHNNNLPKPSNYELEITQVVSQHYCRVIMQAVGRLSRTKYKSPITHILYDREIKKYLMTFNLKQELVVPEFLALHQHCNNSISSIKKVDEQQISLVNKHNSLYLSRQIRELVLRIPNWNKREVKFWNELRQFVLRNPTISKSKLEKSGLLRFYIKSPDNENRNRYFFSTKDDFKNDLNISFDDKIGGEVSFEKIELNNILECEGLKKYFEKNNWANEFQLNEFIMSPPLFKNIYLGALGEEIGKYLIEKFIPYLKLSELDIGEYELFDYKINNETYVDFKFWTERYNGEDNLVQQQKIKRKMQKCGAKKVFIINILNENHLNESVIGTNGIIQIPRLLNLREGKIDTSSISNIIKHL